MQAFDELDDQNTVAAEFRQAFEDLPETQDALPRTPKAPEARPTGGSSAKKTVQTAPKAPKARNLMAPKARPTPAPSTSNAATKLSSAAPSLAKQARNNVATVRGNSDVVKQYLARKAEFKRQQEQAMDAAKK